MHNLHDGKNWCIPQRQSCPAGNDPRTSWLLLVDKDERAGIKHSLALAGISLARLSDPVQPASPSHPQAPEAIARDASISRRLRIPIQPRQKALYGPLGQGSRRPTEKIDLYVLLFSNI
jgi:hypothetical protein